MSRAEDLSKTGSFVNTDGQLNLATGVTGTLPAANGGTGTTSFPSPGTSGNVLTSNGTSWTSAPAAAFDSGTVMIFAQTTAPTGWTKLTNLDNYAMRVVSGTASTGGSVAFTTAFASQTPSGSINTSGLSAGATTLSTTQIPAHNHLASPMRSVGGGCSTPPTFAAAVGAESSTVTAVSTQNTGGGGSHSHSISGSATFTGNAINLAVQYVDVIRASKN